ncbi:MAG TPA: hypothetical protein VJN70_12395 [Gemmatimonadaceae bacterium]|nr:hypothetical protein [Gemmatimonadaceae bacterium]
MHDKQLSVGAKLIVSTGAGDEEDEVIRVLVDAVDAGVWVVETARNARVIVMKGRNNSPWMDPTFDEQHSSY